MDKEISRNAYPAQLKRFLRYLPDPANPLRGESLGNEQYVVNLCVVKLTIWTRVPDAKIFIIEDDELIHTDFVNSAGECDIFCWRRRPDGDTRIFDVQASSESLNRYAHFLNYSPSPGPSHQTLLLDLSFEN